MNLTNKVKYFFFLFPLFISSVFAQSQLQYLSSTTGAACYAVAYYNNFVFAGAGNTLQVYDVSNSQAPYAKVYEHRFTSNIACLKVKGTKLFVAANHAGLSMWDISNPTQPGFLDAFEPDSINEAAYDIAFKADSVFVSLKSKMALLLNNGTSLSLLNRFAYQSNGIVARGCDVKGNLLAYTSAYGPNAQTGVHLLDANTLTQLSFFTQNFCDPEDVIFGANIPLLHVLGGTESWANANPNGLFYSLDITTPTLPTLNYMDTLKGITYLAVAQPQRGQLINDTVYVATVAAYNTSTPFPLSGNVFVYDASNPVTEHKLTEIYAGLWHFDLAIHQHKMYVASEWYGLKTLDISDIYNEIDLGNTLTGGWNTSADIYKNKLVVANEGYGFKLYDITDKYQPQLLDTSNEQGFCYGVSFSSNGNYIYGYFYTGKDFRVYDANSLALLSSIDVNATPATTDWLDAQVWQNKAINIEAPSLSQRKIFIADISNPLQAVIDTQFVAPQVNDILVTPAGKLILANNGSIQVYDLQSRNMIVNVPLAFQNVTSIAFYNDTLYANVNGLFAGLRRYLYTGSSQLTLISSITLPIPNPKFMAADAFGLYLDYQQEGLFAFSKNSLTQIGYFRHSQEFYRPDQWGQKMLMCKDSLLILSEYFGQTSLLTNCDTYFTHATAFVADSKAIQVYPNPATDKINLRFTLSENSAVRLDLYTLQGTIAKRLLSTIQPKGEAFFSIDIDDLAEGQYIIKLNTTQGTIQQKMLKIACK
ncbi:MAG: T9SS type A sorting domain-containing protein [Bacteroidetes bacterium]|nr:T9SS type A sorting domain-containing protein [Bacteroidota bacterium]